MLRFSSAALALILAALTLTACDSEPKDTHPDQLVTKRRAVFKQFTRTLEPMGMVARDRKPYNSSEFMISALELQKLSSQPWPYFTADSNYPPHSRKARGMARSQQIQSSSRRVPDQGQSACRCRTKRRSWSRPHSC